jgi:hypothetical protein
MLMRPQTIPRRSRTTPRRWTVLPHDWMMLHLVPLQLCNQNDLRGTAAAHLSTNRRALQPSGPVPVAGCVTSIGFRGRFSLLFRVTTQADVRQAVSRTGPTSLGSTARYTLTTELPNRHVTSLIMFL